MNRNPALALVIAVLLVGSAVPGGAAAQDSGDDGVRLVYDGETLTAEAASGQAFAGEADLPAGTTLTVMLRSTGENPFLKTAEATVDQDGRFRAVFDFAGVPVGAPFTASVRYDGSEVATAEGEVVECASSCEPGGPGDGSGTGLDADGPVTLAAGPGQAVRGTADLQAGTRLSVRVRSAGDSPFLMTAEATVDQDGRYRAVFDLSDAQPGSAFELVVHHDGTELASTDGEVVECPSPCGPDGGDASDPDTPLPEGELAVQSVVEVDRGQNARIPVSLEADGVATLVVGGESVNFVSNVTVRDGDGDGKVTVIFDTRAAGHDARTASAADSDDVASVPVGGETSLAAGQWALAAGEYPVSLHRGEDATGEEVDVGTLVIRDAEPPDDRTTATTTAWQGEELELKNAIFRTSQGEIARIQVGLGDADAATLAVGGDEAGWTANATVRDGDDEDSAVVVLLDTTAGGSDGPALSVVGDADSISVAPGSEIEMDDNGSIAVGDYDLALYRGQGTDGEKVDVGTLVVEEGFVQEFGGTSSMAGTDAGPGPFGGVGLLGAGGLLAVLAIGLLLGLFRR